MDLRWTSVDFRKMVLVASRKASPLIKTKKNKMPPFFTVWEPEPYALLCLHASMCNFSLLQPHGHFRGSTESLHLISVSAPSIDSGATFSVAACHLGLGRHFGRSSSRLCRAVCWCMSLFFVLFWNLFNAFTSFIVSACGPPSSHRVREPACRPLCVCR